MRVAKEEGKKHLRLKYEGMHVVLHWTRTSYDKDTIKA